ncbi:alkyl salicylate esterase [Alkalilimnicola ehrlichii]|uniref:Alkyl salicylate esterase n=1 Tax=Alkalilimnicola ehrlichii TaxID=351052 RepID=A0A3E0X2D4_9GAMM|nr:alpha/beta fold hydrolase [Alkalilimnicola ehrlichii]RFA28420.1 alkyl salicylate esterase [Alkalilimnicola ehrlichii]RFA38512.1 alkyl salicylate esterase [Alkalilimnicola ehrlichii]
MATTAVLIHGAWAGSWVWDRLLPHLQAQGVQTQAVNLPGNGADGIPAADVTLEHYVRHVVNVIETLPGPIVLVGHSGGGVTATQVAETIPARVNGVAFVAGMMLPSHAGFADITRELQKEEPAAAGIGPHLEWAADRRISTVPVRAACDIFFHDVPAKLAIAAATRLVPQPEKARAAKPYWTAERFGRLPRLYIEALADRSVVLTAQRRMQALVPGATVASLPCGHAPQLAMPEELAACLSAFVDETA